MMIAFVEVLGRRFSGMVSVASEKQHIEFETLLEPASCGGSLGVPWPRNPAETEMGTSFCIISKPCRQAREP